MVTVWIFFGSDETCGGAGTGIGGAAETGGAAVGGGGGQGESAADATCPGAAWLGTAVVAGALKPAGIEFCAEPWPVMIGMVETTRGAALGGSIVTGCSSRETRFSVEPVVAAPACFESFALFACPSP
jgi:hypothetical protein